MLVQLLVMRAEIVSQLVSESRVKLLRIATHIVFAELLRLPVRQFQEIKNLPKGFLQITKEAVGF